MQVKQCKMCKKLFQSFGRDICFECLDKLDSYFIKVRDYLYSNPNAGIMEITENTGVDEKYVLEFIREDRLTLNSKSDRLFCERCGAEIRSGRYCKTCKAYMEQTFTYAESKTAKHEETAKEQVKDKGQVKKDKAELTRKERMFIKY